MIIVLWIFADFSYEGHTSASDLYSIGTREGGGEVDISLDVDVCREDDIVILIQEFHGGADCVVRGRQGVAVKIEDGNEDGGARVITIV